jgi:Polyketide cyclase / dehydrase and lipid transport
VSTYEHSIVIDRPIEDVYKNATCLKGCVNWQTSIMHTEQVTDSPVGVGTRYKHIVKFMGMKGETQPEITVYNPPYEFGYKDPNADIAFETLYNFEKLPTGTRVTVTVNSGLTQSFLGKLAMPVFLTAIRRQFDADMATLKELLENDVTVHAQ